MHWVTHLFLVRVRMGDSEDAWGSQWLKAGMRFFRRMSINIGDDEQERRQHVDQEQQEGREGWR